MSIRGIRSVTIAAAAIAAWGVTVTATPTASAQMSNEHFAKVWGVIGSACKGSVAIVTTNTTTTDRSGTSTTTEKTYFNCVDGKWQLA